MPISARNKLKGSIEEIILGDVMAHVVVRVGENVRIAMYQMLPVSSCQSLGKLNTEAKSFRLGKGTRSQHFIQANARDQLHNQEVEITLVVKIIDGSNVGVVQARECESLIAEA